MTRTRCCRPHCWGGGSLLTEKVACPLKSLKYLVSTDDFAATVEVEEEFRNSTEHTLEVKYQHPIDPNCVITSCEMVIDKRVIKCIMKTKDEARDDYEDAMASGQSTLLAEAGNKTDVMVFNIGIVPPNTSIVVRLKYLIVVSLTPGTDLKGAHITIPQTIIPTYEPNEEQVEEQVEVTPSGSPPADLVLKSKASRVVPKVTVITSDELLHTVGDCKYQKDITITLTRKDNTQFPTDTVRISPGSGSTQTGEEYSLAIPVCGRYAGGEGAGVTPNLLFLVDCSGSMKGSRIASAERCMKYFIQSIPEGTKFNIIRFGSTFVPLFKSTTKGSSHLSCLPLSASTLQSARKFVTGLRANLNGTNLRNPLEEVRKSITEPTQIIVLTDGAVKDTVGTLKVAFSLCKLARISAIGLGDGCSRDLVEGLARFSSGSAHYVKESEVAAKVAAISQEAQQPVLAGASLGLLEDIEGFKPCFPTHKDCGISMLPSESRTILFGFAPEHFDVPKLSEINASGELSAASHEPIVIYQQVTSKKPVAIKVTMTASGNVTFGAKPHEYSRSSISFKKAGVSLRQPDGTVKMITLDSSDKQKLLKFVDCMPQKRGDLGYFLNGSEVRKKYNFEVVEDQRVHQLAAAKRIREIEDMIRIEEWGKEMSQEAIRLSLTFNVMSKFTSFVAVDEDGSCQAIQTLKKVNLDIKSGRLATSRSSAMSPALFSLKKSKCKRERKAAVMPCSSMAISETMECCEDEDDSLDIIPTAAPVASRSLQRCEQERAKPRSDRRRTASFSRKSASLSSLSAASDASVSGPVPDDIVFLQSADGSWQPSPELFSFLSVPADFSSDVFAITAFVIKYFKKHFSHLESEWFLVVSKAVSFLEKHDKQHLLVD